MRDLNQDGISQANELQTLAQSGVKSISLSSSAANTNYPDAILAQSGSFTRSNDSTGQAGSFILAQNNFAREFVPIAVSDEARALPGLKGSGWVRDLREAATLSPELIAAYNQVSNAPTHAEFKEAVAGGKFRLIELCPDPVQSRAKGNRGHRVNAGFCFCPARQA